MSGLTGIKNLLWAFGIVIVVAALLIGLIITMVTGFGGERQDGLMVLGSSRPSGSDKLSGDIEGVDGGLGSGLNELPGSQDTGLEYLFNLTFLCDSTLSAVNSFGANFGSTASAQVWLPAASLLPASNASTVNIIYPNDGSEKTALEAAELYQPSRLVIYLGSDSLGSADENSFVSGYTSLIQGIQAKSPQSKIICCSIGSVTSTYAGADGLTAEQIAQANQWIKQVCGSTGVYYAELASILNDENGLLIPDYANPDGKTINAAGINKLMEYFRLHGI